MSTCPVCGFERLPYPIRENPICPSCYTEFGYDDIGSTFAELRDEWIEMGMPWGALNVEPAPPGWDPNKQLANVREFVPETIEITLTSRNTGGSTLDEGYYWETSTSILSDSYA